MQRYAMIFITINALHVSGGSSAHHQELKTVYTASGICRAFTVSYRLREEAERSSIHKCPQPVPILSQLDTLHTPTSNFLKIHLNIILPSTSGSPQWSLFPQVSPPKPCTHLSCPSYALPTHPISLFSILSPEWYLVRGTYH
jgi:hypothetical protein